MIYICIDHATIYCHSRYSMNRKYEYATDKIDNLSGNEGNKYRPHCYKWSSLEMSDDLYFLTNFTIVLLFFKKYTPVLRLWMSTMVPCSAASMCAISRPFMSYI